ncbi:arylamine N-acetyltransferase [Hydrogenophaga sp. 5NK40-0174]|uniref:arylamine N-acetyltransferase family protein n=1 Tax=Hydrogenophaga sp. 5NK40-0174 TaxID=3127649 RepID=UPI003107330C
MTNNLISSRFDLARYLQRIGMEEAPPATADGLHRLIRQQQLNIAFENLDVQAGKRISIAPDDIVEKLVDRRRGGYCYELHGLFSMALQALGVPYRWVAARPMIYPELRPRTHVAVLATVEGAEWLCDLGFGSNGPPMPIAMASVGEVVDIGLGAYRLLEDAPGQFRLQALIDGEWQNQYGFDLWPQQWVDFEPANHLNCTHPETIFVKQLIAVKHHATGRWVLSGHRLKTVESGVSTFRELTDNEVDEVLQHIFNLPSRQTIGAPT